MSLPSSTTFTARQKPVRLLLPLLVLLLVLPLGCEDPVTIVQPPPAPDSPEKVVAALARAYQTHDPALLASLLAPESGPEYIFLLSAPTDLGEIQWGYAEEVRIHQRMFDPQHPLEGDPPVASELWLKSLTITLTPEEPFAERTDLYTTHGGALDPAIWRAADASYATYVFFDLEGTDYKVEGEANFIVIENLTKNVGDPGKFLLYIWEDIATSLVSSTDAVSLVSAATWGALKELYR